MKKQKVALILFIFMLLLSIPIFAFASIEVGEEYSPLYLKWEKLSEEEKEKSIMPFPYIINWEREIKDSTSFFALKAAASASRYSLTEDINIPVKNQIGTEECWAFTTNTLLETNLKLRNNETIDFSERYLDYATSRTFLGNEINESGFGREVGKGGNVGIALPFYVSGKGPILEEEMPFENNENKIALSEIEGKEPVKKINSYKTFPTLFKTRNGNQTIYTNGGDITYTQSEVNEIRNEIKEHIVKYGAVSAVTFGDASNIYGFSQTNGNRVSYYCDDDSKIINHQVTIVGWDDNYAISNFNSNHRPTKPGAYIVLNSWGENWGENGYYYVSYEDVWIEAGVYGIEEIVDINYDNIYQYDEYGNSLCINFSNDPKIIYGANVFERNSIQNERVTEVGLFSFENMTCEIYINPNNGNLNKSELVKVTNNIKTIHSGYQVIPLDIPIALTGDKFAVAVKYISETEASLSLEYRINDGFWQYVTSNSGESFWSLDMNVWSDLMTSGVSNANICIKAFTEEYEGLQLREYELDGNGYIYKIAPGTTAEQVKSNIITNENISFYNKNNQSISENTIIGTGMKARIGTSDYILVVTGDTNGDGRISVIDLSAIKLHSIGKTNYILTGPYFRAGDMNYDNKINIIDVANAKLKAIGR